MTKSTLTHVEVVVVACGAPKRGMGWYHCLQLLQGRVQDATLTDIVEPFFLGAGKDSAMGKEFAEWAATAAAKGVALHSSVAEMPQSTGPKLAMICGRTADNPKLLREVIDRGCTHVYLEKPGAPTVKELQEMAAYAKAKNVPIFMGYNRNFSKYIRLANDFLASPSAPQGCALTLGRNDCFNTPESLDECFERNAEGMVKNMLCHEILTLVTYNGLTVDSIAEVVADQAYTHQETRNGITDFSRIGCTIKTKSGQKFILWGDRSDGEYSEAVVTKVGMEAFKSVRPCPEIVAKQAELEKATPGCMPYFYFQDGEYLDLKQAVVDHIFHGRDGTPEGVASPETAIEGLKICDVVTEALVADKFEIPLNICNHPSSWGVDYAECPTNPPWEGVIKCIAESGYSGTELGPVGYYDPAGLGEKLESLKLQLVAGNIFEKLHEPAEVKAILEKVHMSCKTLQKHGAKFFVIVPHVAEEKIATAGRSGDAPRLSDALWAQFMDAIKQVAEITKSYGIHCTLHPHAGCWIEYEDEIERAMLDLPADLVSMCLDTGHAAYAGLDAVEIYKKYAARIPYMHFKDANGPVLKKLQAEKLGFWDGIKSGIFCPLGHGVVNFPALLRAMKEKGFSGWCCVEQDADNSIEDVQARLMVPFECCKLNIKYLRSLGVTSASSKFAPPPRACGTFVPGVTDYYTFPPAPYALMVDIFMREKGVPDASIRKFERFIDLPNLENRSKDVLEMNPHGTVPFFKMEDGSFINETIAMCEYIEEVLPDGPCLIGRAAQERATVRMWQRRMEEHYVIPAYYGHRNWTASEDCAKDHFMRDFFSQRLTAEHGATLIPHAYKDWLLWAKNRIMWLEAEKQKEATKGGRAPDFIAGDFISTVDVQVYVTLWFFSEEFPYPPQMILQDLKGQLPWVQAWYDRVHARPAVSAARAYREESNKAYEARKEAK